jgi:hypothetical protein
VKTSSTRFPLARYKRGSEFCTERADPGWEELYRLGGVAALIAVLVALLDIVLSFLPGERDVEPGRLSSTEWFARFEKNRLLALRDLGLWNVINTILALPFYLALYGTHRRTRNQPLAALAAILSFIGAAVYIANNKALPMLALSKKYAAASADDEGDRLVAAGQAMLAQGEDFTPGSFVGFFMTEAAGIVMGIAMLRSRLFGRLNAVAGIAGSGLLLAFTVWVTLVPAAFRRAMALAMGGGVLSMVWNILTARRLFRLGRGDWSAKR